ncbi:hypothetical protein D3C72_1989430 [compost metagenome]
MLIRDTHRTIQHVRIGWLNADPIDAVLIGVNFAVTQILTHRKGVIKVMIETISDQLLLASELVTGLTFIKVGW